MDLILKHGHIIQIDDEDYPLVSKFNWLYYPGGYVQTFSRTVSVKYLHRLLLNPTPAEIVDHISGDRLDNRKQNLRVVSDMHNAINRTAKGYCFIPKRNQWKASIGVSGKGIHIGYFNTEAEAKAARELVCKEWFCEYYRE